ncbi:MULTISPECIES: hypothetical protein [unclassified Prevotella]|nr:MULTISPECIES: hypothetical protein [unclassified Prevotella]MCX4292788.1 hypothetical protein [Prevotella sp.]NPD54935.1 hypothetical protein [Prevotella sp. PTAC]
MSNKNNARRAAYRARQEKEGRKVIIWIAVVLMLLAVCSFVAFSAI